MQSLYRKAAEFRRYFVFTGRLPTQTAEDLVQDVIIKIFRSSANYSGGNGFGDASANAWMWTIARSVMNDHFRGKKVEEVSIDNDGMGEGAMAALDEELSQLNPHNNKEQTAQDCVSRGLEKFAAAHPDRARALEMQLDNEDIASIARRIGRSPGAVKTFICECKKKLAPYIEHCTALLQP